jgi:hypothetical protein
MVNNKGGPAFPTHPVMGQISAPGLGMSLRDFFAARAMQGLLACPATTTRNENMYACDAYTMADAMLRAREQK